MAGTHHSAGIGAIKLTYDDLVATPDDGKRCEILDGELVVTPSPRTKHQVVSANLSVTLYNHVRAHGLGLVLFAPTHVILDVHTVVVPDILFVSAARMDVVKPHAIVGPPDLLIEILSPSTAGRDRGAKAKLYARFGVEHYWIVDAENESLEVFARDGAVYGAGVTYRGRAVVTLPPFPDLSIELQNLWK